MTKPDFEALRARRNASMQAVVKAAAEKMGVDPDKVHTSFNPDACYCSCGSENGVCEHNFQGWREFDDGRGGEQVCTRCGMGAMSHSLRVGD